MSNVCNAHCFVVYIKLVWCNKVVGGRESLPDRLGAVNSGAHARLHVVVVALVLVLLLTPHQVGVGVFLRLSLDQVEGERRELQEGGGVRGHLGYTVN